METEHLNQQGLPLVALCDSMRELTAQLRGILEKLSHEEQAEAQHAALNKSCHPLVASLAQFMHQEAERLAPLDGSFAKLMSKTKLTEAPAPAAPTPVGAISLSGVSPSNSTSAPMRSPEGGNCTQSTVSRVRTRSRARPASPKEREAQPQRKRAASRESGLEREKCLGLVGIPAKVEAGLGVSGRRRSPCDEVADACKPSQGKRAASERSSSNKANQPNTEKKQDKAGLSKSASRARPQTISAVEVASAKGCEGKQQGELSRSARRKDANQEKRTSTPVRRDSQPQRKRAASGESGPERLKRLGLVGIPPGKAEAMGLSGRRRRPSEVSDKAIEKILQAPGCKPAQSSSRRAPSQRNFKKAATVSHADLTMRAKREVKEVQEVMSRSEVDVQQMLEWAATEAARTRLVASLSNGEAQYSGRRAQHQGRLANRLRAATLARARLAREAMQTMLDSSGELPSNLQDDGLAMPRSADFDGWLGRQEAFAQWDTPHRSHPETEGEHDNEPDEELESVVSQDDDSPSTQEGTSYLTDADRQRIGEVLAERRWMRQEVPVPPPRTVLSWSVPSANLDGRPRIEVPWGDVRLMNSDGSAETDRGRPPSRGGESWQPLGQTTPPAYEQVTPELFELWQTQEPNQPPADHESDEQEASEAADSASGEDSHASRTSRPEVSHSSRQDTGPGHQIADAIDDHELELVDGRPPGPQGELSRSEPESIAVDRSTQEAVAETAGGQDVAAEADHAGSGESVEAVEAEAASTSDSTSSCQIEEIEVKDTEGFQVDEWVCEAKATARSEVDELPESAVEASTQDGQGSGLRPGLPVSDGTAHEKVTDEVVSVIMDELINDTIQSSAATEPALRHPTPIAPAFIDIFSEDSAPDGSSAESESVVQPSPRRPLQKNEELGREAVKGSPLPRKMPAKAEEIRLAAGLRTEKKASTEDGPPRPPSPPPDLRSTDTEPASTAPQADRSPKGRQDTAELISQELFDMLLGEALDAFDCTSPGRREISPLEETRLNILDGSTPASPLAGPHPIDTSDAVVAPFIEAVFQQLGVTDEAQPIIGPLPDLEEWLPAVLEVMKTRHRATRKAEDRSKGTPGRPKDEDLDPSFGETEDENVESFTRLLADELLALAHEEVKEQGPRIMGWRRPCFGEAPLSRFRAKQEGTNPSQRQTWEKVREKLTEAVRRFGYRTEGGDEIPAGRTIEADGSSGGAVTMSNMDEGIDALLEEDICSDEASWLDIKGDVQKVKDQVAGMIFMDLVDEMVTEIGSMWSA